MLWPVALWARQSLTDQPDVSSLFPTPMPVATCRGILRAVLRIGSAVAPVCLRLADVAARVCVTASPRKAASNGVDQRSSMAGGGARVAISEAAARREANSAQCAPDLPEAAAWAFSGAVLSPVVAGPLYTVV